MNGGSLGRFNYEKRKMVHEKFIILEILLTFVKFDKQLECMLRGIFCHKASFNIVMEGTAMLIDDGNV